MALLGITVQQGDATVQGYQVHVGAGEQPFGRILSDAVPAAAIPCADGESPASVSEQSPDR